MKKSIKFLAVFLLGAVMAAPTALQAAEKAPAPTAKAAAKSGEPSTRPDAVIFKIHDIDPVLEDGVVKGCNYMITLYNRTSINFRTFTGKTKVPVQQRGRIKTGSNISNG